MQAQAIASLQLFQEMLTTIETDGILAALPYIDQMSAAGDELDAIVRLVAHGVGIALGLGLLSKYTIAILGPAALAFCLADRHSRTWFLRPQPYVAVLIAAALFAPVVCWNFTNDWASFRFQGGERFGTRLGDVVAVETDHAFGGKLAEGRLQKGTFPRPVCATDRQKFARARCQGDAFKNAPTTEADGKVIYLQHLIGRAVGCCK